MQLPSVQRPIDFWLKRAAPTVPQLVLALDSYVYHLPRCALSLLRFLVRRAFVPSSLGPCVQPPTPQGMSAVGLVGPGDIGSSLLANSTATWLIDADSGKMVPHFAEVR